MIKLAKFRILNFIICAVVLGLILSACADNNPAPGGSLSNNNNLTTPTAAPPFPALAAATPTYVSVPTPTEFQPIPALLPTSTPVPLPYDELPGSNGQPVNTLSASKTQSATTKPAKITTPVAVTPTSNGLLAYISGGNLWTISTDGTNRHQVSSGGNLNADKIMWSPNLDRLAYVGSTGNLEALDLGGKHSVLFPAPPNSTLIDAVWSPSGRYLAFTMHANETTAIGGGEIWLVDAVAANFKPRKVVEGFAPAWSPDSRSLAYSTRSQLRDIASLPLNPGSTTKPTAATTTTTQASPVPATPAVPVPYNELAIYELASNSSRTLTGSYNLPPYLGLDNQPHSIDPTTIRAAWWSPNGKSVAFSDRQSFVGIINTAGGQPPVIWTGQPGAFSANQLYWINKDQQPLIMWSSSSTDSNLQLGVVLSPGKFTKLSGGVRADCPAALPGGTLVAYSDNQSTMVVRPDGSIYGLFSGGSCPTWSPDGKALATVKRSGDGSIVIFSPNAAKSVTLQTIKGVDTVYWLKSSSTDTLIQGGAGPKGP